MRRSLIIATLACGSALALTGCVGDVEGREQQIVSPDKAVMAVTPEQDMITVPDSTTSDMALPDLPEPVIVEDMVLPPVTNPEPVTVTVEAAPVPAPKVEKVKKPEKVKKETVTVPAVKPSITPTPTPVVQAISVESAAERVFREVGEGKVSNIENVTHNGYSAYAVTLTLSTGGTITGFVDKNSGVVFDWKQTDPPPVIVVETPAPVTGTSTTPAAPTHHEDEDEDEDEHEDDDHHEDDHDEHEDDDD